MLCDAFCSGSVRARTSHSTHARHRESRSAHAAAATAAPTGQQHAHARRTASRTHRARSPSTAASSSAADSRHHARTTTHDDENMLSAHTGTKPETPIDVVRQHLAAAPVTGSLPCSSHVSVAHTATRPSSQGSASTLRFSYKTRARRAIWQAPARPRVARLHSPRHGTFFLAIAFPMELFM